MAGSKDGLKERLARDRQIKISVIGRKSGRHVKEEMPAKLRTHLHLLLAALAATLIAMQPALRAQSPQNPQAPGHSGTVSLEYMGAAGWQITDGTTVILIDPYLSRIIGPPPPGRVFTRAPGDTRPAYVWDDEAVPDAAAIDSHVKRADFILVTHTHYDHVMDVPHIALKTEATVIGTESTENVLRAYRVPEEQLITVRGGEDYDFGSFSVRVIPSLHTALDHKHYFSSATAPAGMKAPLTLEQMHPEGGTLAYLIRFHGHQILAFGGMNYIEREIDGLRPDVVLVGASPSRREIYDYTGRLMRNLGFPPLVLPTHWDDFLVPYTASQSDSIAALQSFVREVAAVSPKTRVIVPNYFEAIPLETPAK